MQKSETASAATVAQGEPVTMTADAASILLRRFKHDEKMLGPHEQAAIDFALEAIVRQAIATPAAPVAQPVSDKDVIIDGLEIELAAHKDALVQAGRDLAALRSQPRAPLTPRGFLLHWPKPGGGRELIWSEKDGAGVMIGCPVEPVYSYGVRAHGIGQEGGV